MGVFWRWFFDFFWSCPSWPCTHEAAGAGATVRHSSRTRPPRRPDVSGYFTFTLTAVLTAGALLAADLLRLRVPLERLPSWAAEHPLTYLLLCGAAILAGLLAVGDV